jgi:hypothetical protein
MQAAFATFWRAFVESSGDSIRPATRLALRSPDANPESFSRLISRL